MCAAASAHPGAMRAVVKLDAARAGELAAEAARQTDGDCWPVNYNSPMQTVVAGSPTACEKLDELVRGAGGRAMKVAVSGAFHSPYMADAAAGLAAALDGNEPAATRVPVLANHTAHPYPADPKSAAELLSAQVANPVRWTDTIRAMAADGVDAFVEVGPGKTLSGLVKRTLEGVCVYNVETPEELEATASALLARKEAEGGR